MPQLSLEVLVARSWYNDPCELCKGAHPWFLPQMCLCDGGHPPAHAPPLLQVKEMWVCRPLLSYGVLQQSAPQARQPSPWCVWTHTGYIMTIRHNTLQSQNTVQNLE